MRRRLTGKRNGVAFDGATLSALLLAAALASGCVWRLACVRIGPDPDTDAYGHFLIGRLLLETPLNFSIHWVWLPLYHAVLSIAVWLGAGLDEVRSANALAAALPPLVLFRALRLQRRGATAFDAWLPLVAALLTATSPLLMQLGSTGQMEVFFCSLLVTAVALLARGRFGWAAAVLSALVLTRYEGWAVAFVVAATLLAPVLSGRDRLPAGRVLCALLPALCVLGWAALRRLGGEPWFGFLFENQAFAERALGRDAGALAGLGGLARYTVVVPYRVFGASAVLALIGLRRALRVDGIWFVAPGLGILGFLTLSSLLRSQLGLERHFLSVVPFVAVWIAHGIARLAELLERWLEVSRARQALTLSVAGLSCLALALGVGRRLDHSLSLWWNTTQSALRPEREMATFLRSIPQSALIVCAEASVEVLSGLSATRFMRAHAAALDPARVEEWSRSRDVYIVDRARHLGAFSHAGLASLGSIDGPPDALVAIHVRTPWRQTEWVGG